MNTFSELLARKTQLKTCLEENSTSKRSREAMVAELKKVDREIQKWMQRHPSF